MSTDTPTPAQAYEPLRRAFLTAKDDHLRSRSAMESSRRAAVRAAHEAGRSLRETATDLGLSPSTVFRDLRQVTGQEDA